MALSRHGSEFGLPGSRGGAVPSSSGTGKLPTIAKNSAPPPVPLPKLAALDWPPPPSPGTSGPRVSRLDKTATGLGATTLAAASAELEQQQRSKSSRSAEVKARAELWAVRGDIEREKLRSVAPYPFFGRAMRFQDEFCALQVTDDGRFSYSTVAFVTAAENAERAATAGSAGGRDLARRITTFEGILAVPDPFADTDDGSTAAPGPDQPVGEDQTVASIEGRALMRHEIEIELSGRTRLSHVERGSFRFAITVSPFFQPQAATIQPLAFPRSPGRPPPRKRRLPYIGVGSSHRTSPADAELRRQQRRGPKLKFSRTAAPLAGLTSEPTSPLGESEVSFSKMSLPKLGLAASLPQLPSLLSSTASLGPKEARSLNHTVDIRQLTRQQSSG